MTSSEQLSSERADAVPDSKTLLEIDGLTKYFNPNSGLMGGIEFDLNQFPPISTETDRIKAVDDVSFDIKTGETLGLVGESGCGKSTLGRTILQLLNPTDGTVEFKGEDLATLSGEKLRQKRSEMQLIFQDPQSSLDPRMRIGQIIEEPMKAHDMLDAEGREARGKKLLEKVGLDARYYNRYPHAFSGGQRQRVNLARALSVDPDFIVCDEPVSALDVSIQAQVLNTMNELQEEFGLTYLFIAHDLSVVRHISDRVAVMYLGNIVELADKQELFENPQHPYTKALLESIPVPDPRTDGAQGRLKGEVPSPLNPPSGCRFHPRCPHLIAPDEYELDDETWEHTREFMRAVDRKTFDPSSKAEVIESFFSDSRPQGDAGLIVDESIELITANHEGDDADRWEQARTLLVESFADQSICAQKQPEYEIDSEHGTSPHLTACHLHR